MNKLTLSTLGHTWILDLDGTIVKHNGYLIDGKDTFLSGAKAFLKNIPSQDMVIFVTSRKEEYRKLTENFLLEHGISYDYIIFRSSFGERVLVNDDKPGGLKTGIALNVPRNQDFNVDLQIGPEI